MREWLLRVRWARGFVGRLPTPMAKLRFVWWAVICFYRYEMCHDCGGRVMPHTRSWWETDNDLWIEVVAPKHIEIGKTHRVGGGVLCPPCFTDRARAKGISISWHARVEARA
jgi:hypothetical protein